MATADSGVKHEIEGLPVDQRTLEVSHGAGTARRVPAISEAVRGESPALWLYMPPLSIFASNPEDRLGLVSGNTGITAKYANEIAVYCQCMQFLVMDLNRILHADYARFWSHVVYDGDLLLTIDNYLRMAPRWFDPHSLAASASVESLHEELHEVVFKLIMRMSTSRESKSDHMSPETFRQYLDTHIYDAPKLLDICALYGFTHDGPRNPLVRKMLKSVLVKQPKLLGQLDEAAKSFSASIANLKDTCASSPNMPVATIAMCAAAAISLKTFDDEFLLEACTSATELAASLLLLVTNMPNDVLERFSLVIHAMPDFYESVFLVLLEEVERRKDCLIWGLKATFESVLLAGMTCALEVYRHYVDVECMSRVTESLSNADAVSVVERYYAIFMNAISERMFLLAYNSLYPLENDFDDLRKHPATREYMDESHLGFILNSLQAPVSDDAVRGGGNVYGKTVEYSAAAGADADMGAGAGAVGGVSENVASILAVFPDLRTEFVEKCLDFYKDNVDEVVTAIMDNNIHPSLEVFRVGSPPPPPTGAAGGSSPGGSSAAVDCGTVHIGKKNKITKDLLDDRAEKFNLRKVVLQYSDVVDEVVVQQTEKLYDDEYDDTYDSHDVGIPERSTEDTGRAYETPRILAGSNERRKKHWEQEQADEELDEEAARRKQREFCENPEVVRARREQRYQDRMASRGKLPPAHRDVVGNARGQGQSGDVLRNRNLKERHKGGNRKNQSDRKRKEF